MRRSLRSKVKRRLNGQSFVEHNDDSASMSFEDTASMAAVTKICTDFNSTLRTVTSRGSLKSADIFTQVETQSQLTQFIKQSRQKEQSKTTAGKSVLQKMMSMGGVRPSSQ